MKILTILLLAGVSLFAQMKDPDLILTQVKKDFNKIEDYEVDVNIKIDIDFLKVPQSKATIYFKQPDRVKMDSKGFALLPKQGLNFSPAKLLNSDYTAIYSKLDTIDSQPVDVIKVIPNNDSSGIILTSLWIDEAEHVVRKIETTSKRAGTFTIELSYDDVKTVHLPGEVIFSFNVDDMQLPKTLTGDFDEEPQPKKRGKKQMKGTVTVTYSDYKINQGLPDSLFDEAEKAEK